MGGSRGGHGRGRQVGEAVCSQGPAVQHVQRERRLDRCHHGRGPLLVAHAATVLTPAPPQAGEDGGEEGSALSISAFCLE